MRSREQALELVEAAFSQAQHKQGLSHKPMALSALNNRLLQMTDRRFKPQDFGAKDLRAFIAMLSPLFRLGGVAPRVVVERVAPPVNVDGGKRTGRRQAASLPRIDPKGNVPVMATDRVNAPATTLVAEPGRIRKDLWQSIVDFTSGRAYVWDASVGIARVALPQDLAPRMPTLSSVELDEWRLTFLEAHRTSLQGAALVNVQRWQEQRLPTSYLPFDLQQAWNRELTLRVKQRLQEYFANLSSVEHATEGPNGTAREDVIREAFEAEIAAATDRGDPFSVGALSAQRIADAQPNALDGLLAKVTGAWASTRGVTADVQSLQDLSERMESFAAPNLAGAFVNALAYVDDLEVGLPHGVSDFAFKLRDEIQTMYGVDRKSPVDTCRAAVAVLDHAMAEARSSVERFLRTTPSSAKLASIDVLKYTHRLQPLLVAAERQFLRDLDILIGPSFRKICEAYERNEAVEVLRRAPEFLQTIRMQRPGTSDPRYRSRAWLALVMPVVEHVGAIMVEVTSRGEVALAPALALRNPKTKADLSSSSTAVVLAFSLLNRGQGHAYDVSLRQAGKDRGRHLTLIEPPGPFDVPPGGEQLVRLRLSLEAPVSELDFPIEWICQTSSARETVAGDTLHVSQQVSEPDWQSVLLNAPYSLNPIREPDRLYGRESSLHKLRLAAMSGASTFVWGQKRIGKTSLLQVLAAELASHSDFTCLLLRMGEVASLHEGQLALLIAQRLVDKANAPIRVPAEAEFGASLSRLIPFVEQLVTAKPRHKYLVIIDEFDDLDAAFYTGERGKQFVKALRSISEAGLTFFFVGSERMEAIYGRHQADLNKWRNIMLDRIDSRSDCRSLIAEPVAGVIEFAPEAIDFIIDFTAGNPFYINNFCYQVFERCLQEHRTFVDDNDTHAVREQLLRALGPTNFSHLWDDNPVLDAREKRRESAENCVALTCVATLGGRFDAIEDLVELQETLPLPADDRATTTDLRRACDRLTRRGVLKSQASGTGIVIALPIFREWMGPNAVTRLLPQWSEYKEALRRERQLASEGSESPPEPTEPATFPIAEDAILAVAQHLMYCGKQKDVAEIRSWLRQFDDDGRIEMAFHLLQRVTDKGFFNEGAKVLGLQRLKQMVQAKRLSVGAGSWTVVRERLDNLALGYLDSEHKSGATTTRELQKILRPGKIGPAVSLDPWMRAHVDADAMVVIADDFAGTGQTLVEGLKKFRAKVDSALWARFIEENRLAVYVMFAFPEALESAHQEFPGLDIVAATVLGDELRACDEMAGIFSNDDERRFAEQVLLQIGRELSPSAPLGHGGMGALVVFHNTTPNNTLPIFWCSGTVGERPWKALFQRA